MQSKLFILLCGQCVATWKCWHMDQPHIMHTAGSHLTKGAQCIAPHASWCVDGEKRKNLLVNNRNQEKKKKTFPDMETEAFMGQ